MDHQLPKLIVRRIIANIGAAPNAIDNAGLAIPSLLLTKTIKAKYDDGVREHNVYAGQVKINTDTIRGLLVDLTVDIPEYLFIFRMNTLPIHAAKALYDEVDLGETYLRILYPQKDPKEDEPKEVWRDAGMYIKARLLADFERFVSYGFLWEDCNDINDLFEAAVSLLDVK